MTAILFSLAGLLNGIFAQSFDDVSIVPTFVLQPLTYLGGVFYSISMLRQFGKRSQSQPDRVYDLWFPLRIFGHHRCPDFPLHRYFGLVHCRLIQRMLVLDPKGRGLRS